MLKLKLYNLSVKLLSLAYGLSNAESRGYVRHILQLGMGRKRDKLVSSRNGRTVYGWMQPNHFVHRGYETAVTGYVGTGCTTAALASVKGEEDSKRTEGTESTAKEQKRG